MILFCQYYVYRQVVAVAALVVAASESTVGVIDV